MFLKRYGSLFVIIILFTVGMIGIAFLPVDPSLMTRLVMNLTNLFLLILTAIIYKTEKVYWFTGINYEYAMSVGSQRRKWYAWQHVKTFGIFSIIYLILSTFLHIFHVPFYVDIVVFTIGLTATALSTMRYKL
ncbi:MAG: hypothetical protein HUJ53_10535 [Holdemanella sp.]|nr:hypothetical protein [Holdemanella sp.]